MNDSEKTREQTIQELASLRQRVAELEAAENERRRAEAELLESEGRLRAILEHVQTGVLIIDPETHTIVDVNPAAARLFGAPKEQIVGAACHRYVCPADRGKCPITDLGQHVDNSERVLLTADGTARPIVKTVSTVMLAGRPHLLESFISITERKLAETERERLLAEQQRRAIQLQAAAEVSHAVSSILDLDELLPQVVELIRERFDLYYVGLFLVDQVGQWATLRAGTGQAGKKMLEAGHKLELGGASMIGACIANAEARIALDVGTEAVRFENPLLPLTRSEMALPLSSRGRVIGAVTIQSDRPSAFTPEDITVLKTVADQVANAIENARLFNDIQQRNVELTTLNDIISSASQTLELKAVLDAVLRQTMQVVGFDGGLIAMYNEARKKLERVVRIGLPGEIPEDPAEGLEGSLCALVFTEQETVVIQDLGQGAPIDVSGYIEAGYYAYIGVPLEFKGRILGTLCGFRKRAGPFGENATALLRTVSRQIGFAVENARLFEQARSRAQELATLNEMSRSLAAVHTMDGAVESIYRCASRLMDTTNFYVALYHAQQDEVSFPLYAEGEHVRSFAERRRAGRGMTEYVIRSREPLLIPEDVSARAKELGIELIGAESQSWLGAPMMVGGEQVIGVLAVQSYTTPRVYNEHHRDLLSAVASQSAIAVENARLFEQAQARAHRERILREILSTVNASQDLAASLTEIEPRLRELAPLDMLAMTMYTPGEPEYSIAMATATATFAFRSEHVGGTLQGGEFAQPSTRMPVEGTSSGWVITRGKPRLDADLRREKLFMEDEALASVGMASRLVLPLKVGEQVVGTLNLTSAQPGLYTEEHVSILSPVTEQMALALERARLLGETRSALAEVEATQRRYLREKWESFVTTVTEAPTGYIDGPDGSTPVGPTLSPEPSPGEGVLSVPLKLRGEPIGVLEFYSEDAPRRWSKEERAFVDVLADQAALALENARLLDETQMSLADTRALYEASAHINSAITLEEILSALRQYSALGQADLIVAFNLFDTPWVGDRMPEATQVVMRWTALPVERLSPRYRLARFPAARLLRPDQPFVMTDIEHDERLDDATRQLYHETFRGRSALLVPLVVGGQWIGFINAVWSECREFAESDLRRIILLSGQAATAVQTRRLFEQTQARVQQLAALNEISRAASGLLETDKLLMVIREQIHRIVKMDTFFVGLYDFQTRVISYPTCYDNGRLYDMPPEQLSPDARSYGVIFSGEPLLVEYSPEDRDQILLAPDNMIGDTGRVSASLIYVPLRIGDRVIGVMSVQSYAPHVYTQEHVGLMMAIANQVAVALENSRLFEQARHRAVQLATASEAGRAATSILDMNELLQSVVEQVCSRFGYDHAAVFLLDETGQFAILRDATGAAPQDKAEPAIQQLKRGGYQFAVGGQSLVGWVTSKGRSRVVTDVNDDARYLKIDLWPQSRSELCIPLKRGERVIGALDVHSTNLAAFSQDDVAVLEMLTDQLAIAIQNARLYGQTREQSNALEKRAADLAVLNEASRLMTQTFDPAEILNSAAQVVVRHFDLGHAAILLFNEAKTDLRVVAEYPDRGTVGAEAPVTGSSALMKYVASQRAAAIDDVITDPRMESLRMSFLQLSIRSAVFLPLMVKNDLVGYIRLDAIAMLRRFTDEEVSLGQTLASQVAVALQNAWLYQAEQRRAARQSALYQVGRRMTATLDPNDLMDTVVESVQLDLGFERVLILLTDTANGEVYATAASTNFADLIPPNYRQRIGRGMIGLAAQSGQTQLANDTQANPNYYPVGAWNPRSELCVPLEVGGRIIGVLDVESDAPGAFGEEDVRTFESLAGQLAVALENARLYEEQRQTAEKLREVDRLKTEFLANMSHELRTPLNSIIGFSRVILKGIDGPLTDLQKQDLEAIHGSGQQLLGLINDILDISKIEAGKMELAFQQVDLHDIIKGVMSSAVGLVKGKPIVLRQEVPDDLPTVWADVTRARQVLLNLVSNASKFTDKGSITVIARYDDVYVTVGVRDTGIGIPADKLETIFEEFTQVDSSTTRQHGGTGLGLAITRRFVQMHGGRVWAESELNRGSTFYFSLPRTQQVATEADTAQAAEPGKRLLLAVDDDLGVITLYKRYLEKRGYRVVGVIDSRQVVEQARRLKPDVITLDILMPNKDGWSVIQELRQTVDTRHIPVVVCSIISDQGKGFSLGAADYLVKPITEDDLVIALKRLDGRNQATVLIIDDKLEDARLIRRILEAPRVGDPLLGGDGDSQPLYVVQEAHSGAEAIAAVRQNMPNLVLLDLMMPEVDGLAVLEAIKADPATRDIPVIVVTAKELTSQDHERLRGNIGALLAKGRFSEQDLLDDVAAALSSGSPSGDGTVQVSPAARHPVAKS